MLKLTPLEKRLTAEALARCDRRPLPRTTDERLAVIEEQLALILARLDALSAAPLRKPVMTPDERAALTRASYLRAWQKARGAA